MSRHLTEADKMWAIAKLEENWSMGMVAAELNVSKCFQNKHTLVGRNRSAKIDAIRRKKIVKLC